MEVSIILPRLTDAGRFCPHAALLSKTLAQLPGSKEILLLDGHASMDDFSRLAQGLGEQGNQLKLWPLPTSVSWATVVATAVDISRAPKLVFLPPCRTKIVAAIGLLDRLNRFDAVFLKQTRGRLAKHWQRVCRWRNPSFLWTGLYDPDWNCFAVTQEALKSMDFTGLQPAWISQRIAAAGFRVGEISYHECLSMQARANEIPGSHAA